VYVKIEGADQRSTGNPSNPKKRHRGEEKDTQREEKYTHREEEDRYREADPTHQFSGPRYCGSCCSRQLFYLCGDCYRIIRRCFKPKKKKEPEAVPEDIPPKPVKKELRRKERMKRREEEKMKRQEEIKRKEKEREEKRKEEEREEQRKKEEREEKRKEKERERQRKKEEREEKIRKRRETREEELLVREKELLVHEDVEDRIVPEEPPLPSVPSPPLPAVVYPTPPPPVDPTKTCCYLCAENTMAIMMASRKPELCDKSVQVLTIEVTETPITESRPYRALMMVRTIQSRLRVRDVSVPCVIEEEPRKPKRIVKKRRILPIMRTRCPARSNAPCNMFNRYNMLTRCNNCARERNPGPGLRRNDKKV